MSHYLGLLGMPTISAMALASDQGNILAHITAPPLVMRTDPHIREHIHETIKHLAREVQTPYESLVAGLKRGCVAMGGVNFESDRIALLHILRQIEGLEKCPFIVCNNCNASLATNLLNRGCVIRAGTGAMVFIRGESMVHPIVVDGWGPLVGDDGSGYALGRKALRVLAKGEDGRMSLSNQLRDRIMSHLALDFGSQPMEAIAHWSDDLRGNKREVSEISDLAIPLVKAAEVDEDPLARELVVEGARNVLRSFLAAVRRAEQQCDSFKTKDNPLLLQGGLFENSHIYRDLFENNLVSMGTGELEWRITDPMARSIVGSLALAVSGAPYVEHVLPEHKALLHSAKAQGLASDFDQ